MVAQPHFLLFCDTHHSDSQPGPAGGYTVSGGRWHFVLEQLDGSERLEAADSERSMNRERLALLSVVRGLEALEQPSQVSLVTTSRYVSRGLRYGLSSWRESDYTWERFGEQRPVRNSDLWRRVDTALQFHGIKCRLIQAGQANPELTRQVARPEAASSETNCLETNGLEIASKVAVCSGLSTVADRCNLRDLETSVHVPPAAPLENAGYARQYAPPQAAASAPVKHASLPVRYLPRPVRPSEITGSPAWCRGIWWNLAAGWIRWWRGRYHNRHAIFGT